MFITGFWLSAIGVEIIPAQRQTVTKPKTAELQCTAQRKKGDKMTYLVGASKLSAREAKRIEEDLRRFFQTDVTVSADSSGSGSLKFAFYSPDDLERLLDLMLGAARERL